MRSREFPFEIALAAVLGLVVYLNIGVAERVLVPFPETEIVTVTPLRTPQPLVDLPPERDPPPEGLTPAFYPEGELMAFRNVFTLGESFLTRPAEEPRFAEEPVIEPAAEAPVVTDPPHVAEVPADPEAPLSPDFASEIEVVEAKPSEIALRGIVLSDERQAVILEVDGSIQIVTTQQPLPSGLNLVKVEPDSVVLDYQGREYQLSLVE